MKQGAGIFLQPASALSHRAFHDWREINFPLCLVKVADGCIHWYSRNAILSGCSYIVFLRWVRRTMYWDSIGMPRVLRLKKKHTGIVHRLEKMFVCNSRCWCWHHRTHWEGIKLRPPQKMLNNQYHVFLVRVSCWFAKRFRQSNERPPRATFFAHSSNKLNSEYENLRFYRDCLLSK